MNSRFLQGLVCLVVFAATTPAYGGIETYYGKPLCNCTTLDMSAQICHSSTASSGVSFRIGAAGGGVTGSAGVDGSQQTGQTGCVTIQSLPPGQCVLFAYVYNCHWEGWVWKTKVCELVSTNVITVAANCPPV